MGSLWSVAFTRLIRFLYKLSLFKAYSSHCFFGFLILISECGPAAWMCVSVSFLHARYSTVILRTVAIYEYCNVRWHIKLERRIKLAISQARAARRTCKVWRSFKLRARATIAHHVSMILIAIGTHGYTAVTLFRYSSESQMQMSGRNDGPYGDRRHVNNRRTFVFISISPSTSSRSALIFDDASIDGILMDFASGRSVSRWSSSNHDRHQWILLNLKIPRF